MTDPFKISEHQCRWYETCMNPVDMSFHRRRIYLCREHAVLCWDAIELDLREARMTVGDIEEIDRAKQARYEQKLRNEHKAQQRWAEFNAKEDVVERAASRSRSADKDGYVYYLKVGRHIKIGFAQNLERRLASYPPDTELLAVEKGTLKLEAQRHREYSHACAAGREWYDPNPALNDHIAQLAAAGKHQQWDDSEWKRKTPRTPVRSHTAGQGAPIW